MGRGGIIGENGRGTEVRKLKTMVKKGADDSTVTAGGGDL